MILSLLTGLLGFWDRLYAYILSDGMPGYCSTLPKRPVLFLCSVSRSSTNDFNSYWPGPRFELDWKKVYYYTKSTLHLVFIITHVSLHYNAMYVLKHFFRKQYNAPNVVWPDSKTTNIILHKAELIKSVFLSIRNLMFYLKRTHY